MTLGGAYTYGPSGSRERLDPSRAVKALAGCLLCSGRIVCVGVFTPHDATTRQAVLTLREHELRPHSTPGLLYGLCALHAVEISCGNQRRAEQLAATVEDIFIAMAAKATVQ